MNFQEVVGVSVGVVVFVGFMNFLGRAVCAGSHAYDAYENSLEPRELEIVASPLSESPSPPYMELFL